MQTDVLIIGSGIAGLAFAIKLAERKPDIHITLVTKADRFESNTKYAQGGIAAVMDNDHHGFESHINDTLKAGKGFSNVQTVKLVVENAPKRLKELIDWGTPFDKTPEGNWDYGLEGGHSVARILHHKDQTGLALEKVLLRQLNRFKNVHFKTKLFATDLITQNKQCFGAKFLDQSEQPIHISSHITYLATGGSGQVFSKTTNPLIATGDGLAMASRAGAAIDGMGFYQFHPTALAVNDQNPVFLITEALRGFGAHLINQHGERFLSRYHPDGELATRDVISEAIFKEMHQNNIKNVWLDCRHLDKDALKKHFPNIIEQCKGYGIDVFTEAIPIAPAAHYQCGGIKINFKGKTSIKNLYANGECASTGLHGANRLASNSLLEAIVFAHEAAVSIAKKNQINLPITPHFGKSTHVYDKTVADSKKLQQFKTTLQQQLYQVYYLKIQDKSINAAARSLSSLCHQILYYTFNHRPTRQNIEIRNLAIVAQLYVNDSLYDL